jgi:hypothetical protein
MPGAQRETTMLGLIIGTIACAFTAAKIAESKGRSRQNWFILGALFGFFAVITVAFLRPLKADELPAGHYRYEQSGSDISERGLLEGRGHPIGFAPGWHNTPTYWR